MAGAGVSIRCRVRRSRRLLGICLCWRGLRHRRLRRVCLPTPPLPPVASQLPTRSRPARPAHRLRRDGRDRDLLRHLRRPALPSAFAPGDAVACWVSGRLHAASAGAWTHTAAYTRSPVWWATCKRSVPGNVGGRSSPTLLRPGRCTGGAQRRRRASRASGRVSHCSSSWCTGWGGADSAQADHRRRGGQLTPTHVSRSAWCVICDNYACQHAWRCTLVFIPINVHVLTWEERGGARVVSSRLYRSLGPRCRLYSFW